MTQESVASSSPASPLVSVIVPAFNHESFVRACLDSVLESSYRPLELIVLDDGSSDGTYALARDWMRLHAHELTRVVVERQSNRGLTRTLNVLVRRARGEFLVPVASDDELEPDGISLRVNALQSDSKLMAVFGDCKVIDDRGRVTAVSALRSMYAANTDALADPRSITRELILRWSVPGPAVLLRRPVFESGGGMGPYNEQFAVEDRDLYLGLLARDELGFVPDVVARYRIHGENFSISRRPEVREDVVRAERLHLASFRGMNRWLLILVAARGGAEVRVREGSRARHGAARFALALQHKSLGALVRLAYLVHTTRVKHQSREPHEA